MSAEAHTTNHKPKSASLTLRCSGAHPVFSPQMPADTDDGLHLGNEEKLACLKCEHEHTWEYRFATTNNPDTNSIIELPIATHPDLGGGKKRQ